jgi:hypothetical protein
MRKRQRICFQFLVSCLAAALAVSAQSQQPPPKPDEKPKPAKKAKKVWSEDDLTGLRKPSDEYAERKAAEADAAAKAAEAKPGEEKSDAKPMIDPISGKPFVDPESPEGMAEQLRRWEQSLTHTETQLREARARLADTSDAERWETAKAEVDILESNLLDTQRRIDELKAKLAANPPKEKPPAAGQQAPAPSPPPPPPQ